MKSTQFWWFCLLLFISAVTEKPAKRVEEGKREGRAAIAPDDLERTRIARLLHFKKKKKTNDAVITPAPKKKYK